MAWNVTLPLSHNGCVRKTSGSGKGVAIVLSWPCHSPRLSQKLVQVHGILALVQPFLLSTHIYKYSVVISCVHALFWNERGHHQSSLSGIAFVHKINNLANHSMRCTIQRALKGIRKTGRQPTPIESPSSWNRWNFWYKYSEVLEIFKETYL